MQAALATRSPPGPGSRDDERGRGAWSSPPTNGSASARNGNGHGAAGGGGHEREASLDANADKKGSAAATAKSLSHVPCKFFRQGACTAGKACVFSHDLTVPGTSKPVCQWYAKGNCKFGHKCALAHILPGQPMSMDRKNKRAAQAALREANHADGSQGPTSPSQTPTSPNQQPRQQQQQQQQSQQQQQQSQNLSGIGRSLKNSLDLGRPSPPSVGAVGDQNGWTRTPTTPTSSSSGLARPSSSLSPTLSPFPPQGQGLRSPPASHAQALGSSSSPDSDIEHRSPRPTPQATLFPSNTPSGLSQTLHNLAPVQSPLPSPTSNGRSTVAAQVMLSQQTRRLSSSTPDHTLSPGSLRMHARPSTDLLNPSPAVPLAAPSPSHSSNGIFSTSPFSGSRALFLPSSYDSGDEGGFLGGRSPPGPSSGHHQSPWDRHDEGDDGDEDDFDDFDEGNQGFLPSSLSDLLTPEEQRRRASKNSAFDPFSSHTTSSRSVPAELMLARGRPVANALPFNAWGTLTSSSPSSPSSQLHQQQQSYPSSSYTSPPPAQRSLLSSSPSLHNHVLSRNSTLGQYPHSFDPSSAFRPPNAPHAALPGSLPGGLAAGLSQLHLVPAIHTGETPPSDGGAWTGTPLSWGSVASNASEHHFPNNNKQGQPRRPPGAGPVGGIGMGLGMQPAASPLHHSVRTGYPADDEIQFDMDA
ncbi:hypothetical protein RQP46_008164 [Phenoliferia psychrophenolica]